MKYAETYSGRNDFLFFCHFYDTTKRRAEGITISKSMSWMIIWWCSSSHKKYPVWTPFLTTTAAAHLCCVSHVVYCFFSSKNFPTSPRRPSASFSATILGLTITVKISWELQNRRYKMVYFCLLLIALKGFYKHQKKTPQILRERGWEEGLKFPVFEQRNKKGFESPDKCVDLLFELIQILYRNSFTESAEETLWITILPMDYFIVRGHK